MSGRRAAVVAIVISAVFAALAFFSLPWAHICGVMRSWSGSRVEPVAFDRDVWLRVDVNTDDTRIAMAEWLSRREALAHLTHDSCIALIGAPDWSFDDHGRRTDVYVVGWEPEFQSSNRVQMIVRFNREGRVESVDVR
jgi:hypothetical protein